MAGGVLAVSLGVSLWLHIRLMPYRKDLLEDSHGVERLKDFMVDRSWIDNLRSHNYTEGGHAYLGWLRGVTVASWVAIIPLIAALVASLLRHLGGR
jgi:hypothetical protein